MRNFHFIWSVGFASVLALGLVAGCGSDDDEGGGKINTGGTGGSTGGTGGSTGGASGASTGGSSGASTGGSSGAGTGGSAGGGNLSCDGYCTSIMASCTGANSQFTTKEICMAVCGSYPEGAQSDTSGNTLGCRLYHAGAASADAATHCKHAGPAGVGTCGSSCEGYCNMMLEFCPSEYQDAADCTTTCAGFEGATGPTYDSSMSAGSTLQCRIYHASAASLDAATHCKHAKELPTEICK
jgi:hypothetical protein